MGPLVRLLGLNKQSSEIAERNLTRIIDELDRRLRKKIGKLHVDGHKIRSKNKVKDVTAVERRSQRAASALKMAIHGSDAIEHEEAAAKVLTQNDSISTSKAKSSNNLIYGDENDEGHNADNTEHAHLNHHEFEHVDWKSVYQYMPVESAYVYALRIKNREINAWWGISGAWSRWEAQETGCLRCVGKALNSILHNWCGCCLVIPPDIKHCMKTILCCGQCSSSTSDDKLNSGGGGGCCCCTPKYQFSMHRRNGMHDSDIPLRLQRRWGKCKFSRGTCS